MDKLSFASLTEEVRDSLISEHYRAYEELALMLDSFLELSFEGTEAAVAVESGCLLVRIFDGGEYTFVSPIALYDNASIADALISVRDYAVREMLPLAFTDVPRSDLDFYTSFFKLPEAHAYADDEDMFFIRVLSECTELDGLSKKAGTRVTLSEITEEYTVAYARLCNDAIVNRYWGYDAACDNTECRDEFHIEVARREFNLGIALTYGVFLSEEFIGEAVLYNFDFTGGASIGVRLLKEYQSEGLGSEAFGLIMDVARDIGLDYLEADVLCENTASIKMTSKFMNKDSSDGNKVHFSVNLR